jgi:hypothetical protein
MLWRDWRSGWKKERQPKKINEGERSGAAAVRAEGSCCGWCCAWLVGAATWVPGPSLSCGAAVLLWPGFEEQRCSKGVPVERYRTSNTEAGRRRRIEVRCSVGINFMDQPPGEKKAHNWSVWFFLFFGLLKAISFVCVIRLAEHTIIFSLLIRGRNSWRFQLCLQFFKCTEFCSLCAPRWSVTEKER